MAGKHTETHTAAGGVTESVPNVIRSIRKRPIIGAGKLQDMNNVEYDATIFDAISDEKGASDEVHWEYDVSVFNPDFDAIIKTTVTWNNSRVDKWIDEVKSDHTGLNCHVLVGVAAWCEPRGYGPLGALCLCTGTRCLVYQINVAQRRTGKMPDSLANFLENHNNQFVSTDIELILENLQNYYSIGKNVRYSNLREEAAVKYRIDTAGMELGKLAQDVTKTDYYLKFEPGEKESENWGALQLKPSQVLHGAFTTYVIYEIGWHLYHFDCCKDLISRFHT